MIEIFQISVPMKNFNKNNKMKKVKVKQKKRKALFQYFHERYFFHVWQLNEIDSMTFNLKK